MQSTSVTAIIPYYNREHTIERCLNSIVNQTKVPSEVIIVDDGSRHDVPNNIITKYQGLLNLIVIKHTQNTGVSSARNSGIRFSSNEIIAFLDSDDAWLDTHIESCLDIFSKYTNVGFVFGAERIYNSDNHITEKELEAKKRRSSNWEKYGNLVEGNYYSLERNTIFERCIRFLSVIRMSTVSLHTGRLSPILYFDEQLHLREDEDFCIRLSNCTEAIYINAEQVNYYLHGHNTISHGQKAPLADSLSETLNEIRFIRNKLNTIVGEPSFLYEELAESLYVAGLCYKELGELEKSYKYFLRSFQIRPKFSSLKHLVFQNILPQCIQAFLYNKL